VSGNRTCVAEGSVQEGQACGASAPCAPGLLCVPLSSSISTCEKFCSSDADCTSPGGLCQKTLGDGQGGTIPNATLCSENCNPISNSGCSVSGTSCRLARESGGAERTYTDCGPAGTKTQGASCDPSLDECAPGYTCMNVSASQSNCLQYCAPPAGSCPPTTTCVGLTPAAIVGGTSYGVCL
jgi:hypothetical protein